jgi:hypothetical protein
MKAFIALFVAAAAMQLVSAGVPLVNGTCPAELCPSIGESKPEEVTMQALPQEISSRIFSAGFGYLVSSVVCGQLFHRQAEMRLLEYHNSYWRLDCRYSAWNQQEVSRHPDISVLLLLLIISGREKLK